MLAVLTIVLPIFALIFAGWGARRIGVLGPNATGELNRFVVYLALPALLFDIVANASWSDIWRPGFVGAFGLGAGVVLAGTVGFGLLRGRRLPDAAVDGLNAAYPNTGYIGFPLLAAALGQAGLAPTLMATIITVCVVFAAALVLIETGLQSQGGPLRTAGSVVAALVRNPLLVAPLLGAVFLALGIKPPAPAESFLKLIGAAASPCALVALGLFLAEKREGPTPACGAVGLLVGLKLAGQPLATWALGRFVFQLEGAALHAAVLLAALPTGTGPFMVAEFYKLEAGVTARVVLISTILSVATLSLYLALAL